MTVGETIKRQRMALGMAQGELAEMLGVSQAMISQIEKGRKPPSLMLSKEIAGILNCSVDSLLDGSGGMPRV